jgi:hypothetical protein
MPHNANRRTYLRPSGPRHNVIKNTANSTLTWKRIPKGLDPAIAAAKKKLKPREERRIEQKKPDVKPLTYNPFQILKSWYESL